MLEKDFQELLKQKNSVKEVKKALNILRDTAQHRFEIAMEKEDLYLIGFAAGTVTSLTDAIQLLDTINKETANDNQTTI